MSRCHSGLKLRPPTFPCWGGRGSHRTLKLLSLPSILPGLPPAWKGTWRAAASVLLARPKADVTMLQNLILCGAPSPARSRLHLPWLYSRGDIERANAPGKAQWDPAVCPGLSQDRDHFGISKRFTCSLRCRGPKEALKSIVQLLPGCREQNLATAERQLLFTLFPRTRQHEHYN